MTAGPVLSVIIVSFDMARELPRTLRSLSPDIQQGLARGEVEILVVDNGSTPPVSAETLPPLPDLRIIRIKDGGVSPCRGINRAAAEARGRLIAIMVDGARMASPGLLSAAVQACGIDPLAFVATLGFHLGPKVQQISVTEGYDRAVEDGLLASIGWPDDGYRLFEISSLGESYARGAWASPPETTFFAMARDRFLAIGGFDERFASPGGGLANFDVMERALADPAAPLILLVGEATFHQLHYGATTQASGIRRAVAADGETLGQVYAAEYARVRGHAYAPASRHPFLFGRLTHPAVGRLFFPDVSAIG
ncbi:glycosyltransferase family 2 protein [Brevundimonas sp. TWP2-3-4b1]|uniref:glycosyltransferase family 2 protein n=1 Tax=Brevundimonas sp. TWP2-3-4b1 TaxID=2804580 RepID=UPI003CF400EE